jgi:hypothetical protein
LIISTLASLFLLINNAISASVGNLVASSDKEYVYSKYQQIKFIYAFLSAFSTICMLVLFQPFIQVWTRGGEYLLNFSTVVMLCVSFYFSRIRSASSIFKDAAGLFWQNRFAPIFESLINLGVSIGLGLFMGIDGIVIGTILSTLLVPFWLEPQIVYKHYFKKSFGTFLKTTVRDLVLVIVSSLLCLTICSFIPDSGIVWLLVKFSVCIPLSLAVLIVLYIPTKEFKDCFQIVKMYFAKLFKSK